MDNQEAIEVIKSNWPDERYMMLREALTVAIEALTPKEHIPEDNFPYDQGRKG